MQLNLLDYFFIAILILSAWAGYRQGLMDAIGGLLGTLGGLVVAILYREELAFYLDQHYGLIGILGDFLAARMPALAWSPEWGSVMKGLGLPQVLVDPTAFLAQLLLLAASFFLILLVVSVIIKIVFGAMNALLAYGGLDGVNRWLGLLLVMLKNIIIMTLLIGLLYPAINLAARMGSSWAVSISRSFAMSWLAPWFLEMFSYGKVLLGI
ncbi:MAG: CvpA family protein [Syntrophomonas sp.]|uniref:CvpA family protein n=1 Tax=Syntrophomonas sp. TaxID=2053627 RepID=UPI0026138EB9|nr:CvpA family protein [Syntrophomonas sp.]MDD2511499.1 CvpA family protein [Syntrophomonas sp.]MDD3880315.1 CvpA family protein [Syntrophomonas sp.]MDD4626280.1 CvpA family protein [Syntrophomonas sp.]